MDDLEQQLRRALARKDPSPWFEAKVLAAVTAQQPVRRTWWERLRWATVPVAAALVIAAVVWQHQRADAERAAGLEAKARLQLALKVTRVKLEKIQHKVQTATNDM